MATKTGTSGNDRIVGTPGDDILRGEDGNDTLVGGAGNDILEGGKGADTFVFAPGHGEDNVWDFEVGADIIDLTGFDPRVTWEALSGKATTAENILFGSYVTIDLTEWGGGKITIWGVDSLTEDMFTFPGTPVTLTGTGGGDVLEGNWGDDTISGGGGNDYLYGRQGDDTLKGGAGNDVIGGGQGDDTIVGGAGDDKLWGDADLLDTRYTDGTETGETDNDTFVFAEGHGNDTIHDFEPESDTIDLSGFSQGIAWFDLRNSMTATDEGVKIDLSHWGGGTITLKGIDSPNELTEDMFVLPDASVTLTGTGGDDILRGGAEDDTLSGGGGNDHLTGLQGDDTLEGGAGNDILVGWQGNDTIVGGAGDDKLAGDAVGGDDRYADGTPTGETDNDTFVFAPGDGNDTILDFTDGEDVIDLTAFTGISGFGDINARQDGNNVVIDFSGDNSVTLVNFDLDDLDAGDFVFHDTSASVDGV